MRRAHRGVVAAAIVCVIGVLAPGAALAATATLPTLLPTADGTRDATVQVRGVTLAFDAIDEGLAAADTTSYLQNQQGFAGRYFALLTDMPGDFTSIGTLSISIRARTVGISDDQTTLFAQVVAADETTALSNEVLVATNPGPGGWTTVSNVALSGLTPGSKATWDGARLRLRWAYSQVGTADSTQLRLTVAELHGTYNTGGGPPPDLTPPNLTSAAVNGAALTLSYSEALDGGSVPAASAYAVAVNSSPRSISTVGIGGSTVTLTLSSPVTSGQTVTLSYTIPGTNPIQDVAGNDAAAFSGQAVANNTPPPGDTDPPLLTSATVNGAALTLGHSEPLDGGSVPAASAYAVLVNATSRSVGSVGIGGSTVTLTLSSPVTAGQTISVSYAVPATNPVQDGAGNDAAAFSGQPVTNNTPGGGGGVALPTLLPTADGSRDAAIQIRGTTLAFDAINEGLGAADTSTYLQNQRTVSGRYFALLSDMPADFTAMSTLTISVRARTLGVSNDQTKLFAQLFGADETTVLSSEALVATNPGTASWTTVSNVAFSGLTSGSKALWDGARLRLRWAYTQVGSADSTQLRVTVAELHGTYTAVPPPPDLDPPLLTGAAVNGTTLSLTYNEPLDTGSRPAPGDYEILVNASLRAVSALGIGGAAVTLTLAPGVATGDTVTASYTVPAANPVQDPAGNDAAAFSGQPVTNNTPPPGGAVNASGNEITDAVRAAGFQGDGRSADSSFGIWEAATNLDTNGGFENGSTAGWSATGGSFANSIEQARFGTHSGKAVSSAPGDLVAKAVGGLAASTDYSRSLWIYRTETGATLTIVVLNNAGTANLASATAPPVLGWSRIVLHPRTESGQTSLTTRISSSLGGVSYYLDGTQLERNVVATPYVETNGSTATRGPSKVSVVGNPVGPTQGWVAVRIRFGWDSTAPFSPDPGIVDMSVSNDDALFCYWDEASHTFHLERHKSGAGTHASSAAQTFSAGTVKTVIYAWTATDVRISVDGGAFVGTGNTTIPGQATLYIGSDHVQGNGHNRQGDSDYLWVAGGSGTLTNADAATIHAFGDSDHAQGDFPGGATFAWPAN
ncbi:MAG: SwmB domain-containing protein [Candidatus Limnocylindrales bacterium]